MVELPSVVLSRTEILEALRCESSAHWKHPPNSPSGVMIKRRSFGLKRKTVYRLRRKKIRKQGKAPVSKIKRAIQANLRSKAILRDGGCVLRHYLHWLPIKYQSCGRYRADGELILQAEHLVGRANSASYADMDNIVCLCVNHHFFFKRQHGALYWEIIRKHIGEERWRKIQEWEQDKATHKFTTKEWRDKLLVLQ